MPLYAVGSLTLAVRDLGQSVTLHSLGEMARLEHLDLLGSDAVLS